MTKSLANASQTNSTQPNDVTNLSESPKWEFIPIFQSSCSIGTIITNFVVLLCFWKNPALRTAFNVYLISLLSGNLLYALFESVLDVINSLYTHWTIGAGWCTFYIYGLWVWQAFILEMHVAITFNRIWAIFFPVSYRNCHSKKIALFICLGVLIYTNACTVPFLVIDQLYYHLSEREHGCSINTNRQWTYATVLQFGLYDLAFVIIIVAYPFMWHKNRLRRRTQVGSGTLRATIRSGNTSNHHGNKEEGSPSDLPNPSSQNTRAVATHRTLGQSRGFLVLSFLTGSVCVFWLPSKILFTMFLFTNDVPPTFTKVAISLQYLQSLLDPVYFTIALRDLQAEFRNLVLCRSCTTS